MGQQIDTGETDSEDQALNTRPAFKRKLLGVRECEIYRCQVIGCGLDCGDQGTLARHMKREHRGYVGPCDKSDVSRLHPEST